MALTESEQDTLKRLKSRLNREERDSRANHQRVFGFATLAAYRQGTQRLEQLGIAVPDDFREFTTIANWPGTYVDSILARLRPQGFLLDGEADDTLWSYWQANNLDTEIRMGFDDMLTFRRGYLCAGAPDEGDMPLITVESPRQMMHEWSPRRRQVTAVGRFYTDESGGQKVQHATFYQPDSTHWLVLDARGDWVEEDRDEHGMGRVPVEVLVNRATTDDRYGVSEMLRVTGLTDACARALTNAQFATEVVALPQKWAAGMSQADFTDQKTGELLTQWESYIGAVWATENQEAKFGQFTAADLGNFKTIVSVYAQLASGETGLPMRYFGQLSDNPPSADGIRADESRLIGTAEEKQLLADGPLEGIIRTADRIATGDWDPGLLQLETQWRDASTPSEAQKSDRATKLRAARVISNRQALRDLGYTPRQIDQIEDELREEERVSDPFALLDPSARAAVEAAGGGGTAAGG